MKVLAKLLLVAGIFSFFSGEGASAEISLQSQINATPAGGTLRLQAGTYHETIVLKKPIVLEGEKGTILSACSYKPAILITGKEVSLKGIKIVSCEKNKSPFALFMSGKNHHLEDVTLDVGEVGIKLENVAKTSFLNINIEGSGKDNAIDLWESHQNSFERVTITNAQDGFYLENSHYNTFIGNTIRDSRYGLHIMFSDNITAIRNVSINNYTGAMVMGTNHSVLKENQLIKNNQNVNAQGLLLYEVFDSVINDNQLSSNRVGLFMEDSSGNELKGNEFTANYVGAQINRIEKNIIEGNTFISNVNDFQATAGTNNNIIRFNYWDAAMKLDSDGDGRSNLPHPADPYFLNLTKETPAYQLFFHHPGLVLLQKMLKSPEHTLVTDAAPLMINPLKHNDQTDPQKAIFWVMSLIMMSGSLLIIYFGRKKT
ncbi:MAG: right-handed parallel beta-helix repeat-containing protein [Bacillus sp. (in: Bacteria)]|nr:right-handed parallel beta-helix repeat-containing protein [Bacillus sp. (in: firmicutes)]